MDGVYCKKNLIDQRLSFHFCVIANYYDLAIISGESEEVFDS